MCRVSGGADVSYGSWSSDFMHWDDAQNGHHAVFFEGSRPSRGPTGRAPCALAHLRPVTHLSTRGLHLTPTIPVCTVPALSKAQSLT